MTKFYFFWVLLFINIVDTKTKTIFTAIPTLKDKSIPNHIKCFLKAYRSTLPYPVTTSYFILEQQKMISEIESSEKPLKKAITNCWEEIIHIPKVQEVLNTQDFQKAINYMDCTRNYVECPEDIKKSLEHLTNNFPCKPTFFHKENFRSCEVIEEKDKTIKIIIDANFFRQYKNDLAWPVIFEHENGHVRLGHHRDPSVYNKLIFTQLFLSRFNTKIETAFNVALTELYHCREKQADIFALQQPHITLNHMIAFKQFFEKHKAESSLTHPSSADRIQYIDRLIRAYMKDIEHNDAPLD